MKSAVSVFLLLLSIGCLNLAFGWPALGCTGSISLMTAGYMFGLAAAMIMEQFAEWIVHKR